MLWQHHGLAVFEVCLGARQRHGGDSRPPSLLRERPPSQPRLPPVGPSGGGGVLGGLLGLTRRLVCGEPAALSFGPRSAKLEGKAERGVNDLLQIVAKMPCSLFSWPFCPLASEGGPQTKL